MERRMLERRGFVTGLTAAIVAVIGSVVGFPLAGYTILPALRRRPGTWADIEQSHAVS
jgi:hypothetical protein